jgi:hypothetical protein
MERRPVRFTVTCFAFTAALLFSLVVEVGTAWADYEIYHKKGFQKAAEILEKETNEDGTLRVKAKKANGEVVVIDNVENIVEVAKKKGVQDSGIVPPTPTPLALPGVRPAPKAAPQQDAPSDPEAVEIEDVAENYRPDLTSFTDNIKWVALAVLGVGALVVLLFIFARSSQ